MESLKERSRWTRPISFGSLPVRSQQLSINHISFQPFIIRGLNLKHWLKTALLQYLWVIRLNITVVSQNQSQELLKQWSMKECLQWTCEKGMESWSFKSKSNTPLPWLGWLSGRVRICERFLWTEFWPNSHKDLTKIRHLTAFLIAAKSQGSEMVGIVEMVTHILPPGIWWIFATPRTRMHRPRALEDLCIGVTSYESISTSHDVQHFRVKSRVSVLCPRGFTGPLQHLHLICAPW